MQEKVKKLWKLCFNDSDEFTELYFRMRYQEDRNIAIANDQEVVAALQLLPYPMTFCRSLVPTAYVSGACTHPNYRNLGIMRKLLSLAFERMYRDNVLFSTLIPADTWLFDYYARMGYVNTFHYSKQDFYQPDEKSLRASLPTDWTFQYFTEYDEMVYQYLNRKLHERPCCLQHTESDFHVILADLNLGNGRIFTLSDPHKILGVAVAYPDIDATTISISELVTEDDTIKQILLNQICQEYQVEKLSITTPPSTKGEVFPLGMARIIRPLSVLQLYAASHPDITGNLALIDKQIPANNGYYYLQKGECRYSRKPIQDRHIPFSIKQLTERAFSSKQPFMSLMLN